LYDFSGELVKAAGRVQVIEFIDCSRAGCGFVSALYCEGASDNPYGYPKVEAIARKRGSTIMTSATERGFKGSALVTKQV